MRTSSKDFFKDRVIRFKLPIVARKLINDDRINKCLADTDLSRQIENAFMDEKLKKDIIKNVSEIIKGQFEKMLKFEFEEISI